MPTIFVDSGSEFLNERHAFPVVSVGDGDSFSGALDHLLPARKDFSDLAFALRSLPTSVHHLELFGFLEGRRDHELANFGEVHKFLTSRSSGLANFHQESLITVIGFRGHLELEINGIFSVLAFAPTNVNISGDCEYKFEGPLDAMTSHGLSNVGYGKVIFEAASPLFIYLN